MYIIMKIGTIGYGDVYPVTSAEKIYTILITLSKNIQLLTIYLYIYEKN